MLYEPVTNKPLTAKEYWDRPPLTVGEQLQGYRDNHPRKTDLLSMLDFAEVYGDYICGYEKAYDYQRGGRNVK